MPGGRGDSLPAVLLTVVVAFSILLLGVAVINPVVEQATDNTDSGDRVQTNVVASSGTGTWYRINEYSGVDPAVVTSRGYAVNLTGAPDSYVQSDSDVDVATDDTWTVSVWARVDGDATAETMTALSVDGELLIRYNRTSAEWVAWYYDSGSGSSHEITVSDASQPGAWANVQVRSNGTHLEIYHNNTAGGSVALSTGEVIGAPVNSSEWNGRLEEVRTFDDALNNSTRQQLVDQPIGPQPATNRTARAMFDEPYASQQLLLFSDASLTTSNVTFGGGFAGDTLDRGEYAATGADYKWNEEGPKIRLLEGGDADDLPVVYVDYTLKKLSPTTFVPTVTTVLGLAALVPILLIVGWLLAVFRRGR